jgi:hypothetical protein
MALLRRSSFRNADVTARAKCGPFPISANLRENFFAESPILGTVDEGLGR